MKDEYLMLVLSSKAFNDRTGIVIGLPMTHAQSNEKNPFAVKYLGPKNEVAYILTHQPKSFDWRLRASRPHHWKQVSSAIFEEACEGLNSIISIAN
jgi:mRNA interferase MazF